MVVATTNLIVSVAALASHLMIQTDAFLPVRSHCTQDHVTNRGFLLKSVIEAEDLMDLTPMQTKHLRKEAAQRRARNNLTQLSYEAFEDDQELLRQLTETLATDGLVEVRAISKDSRRHVHQIAEAIAEEAGELQTTFLLSVKGHSAVFFSPTESIPLRTTSKRNEWMKRDKPERDDRGQLIK